MARVDNPSPCKARPQWNFLLNNPDTFRESPSSGCNVAFSALSLPKTDIATHSLNNCTTTIYAKPAHAPRLLESRAINPDLHPWVVLPACRVLPVLLPESRGWSWRGYRGISPACFRRTAPYPQALPYIRRPSPSSGARVKHSPRSDATFYCAVFALILVAFVLSRSPFAVSRSPTVPRFWRKASEVSSASSCPVVPPSWLTDHDWPSDALSVQMMALRLTRAGIVRSDTLRVAVLDNPPSHKFRAD